MLKRCTSCVLPETYPGISFDQRGVCHFCRTWQKLHYLGDDRLQNDLDRYASGNGNYDCLVPISGGKDSVYVLYQLTTRFHKRVLAFNYDNGLGHPQAQENISKITKRLGVDLVVTRNEKQRDLFRTNLKAYLIKPDAAMIPMICTGCRYGIMGNAFKLARAKHIPAVVIGWSPIEDTPFKEALLRRNGNSVLRGLLRQLRKNPKYMQPKNMVAAVKDYFHNYSHVKNGHFPLKMLYPNVHLLEFYDYMRYHPDDIQKTVENELNWSTPDQKDTWQFDCKIKLVQNYLYENTVAFTATDGYLSSMIREGMIPRTEALKRLFYLKEKNKNRFSNLEEFLREMNLSEWHGYLLSAQRD